MSARLIKAEAWALNIISMVSAGAQVEDARVELKRQWPEHHKAARRIAGHANSCFGSDILWIIGLDEREGVVGVEAQEFSEWWPKVCSFFDGVTPSLTEFVLPFDGNILICLLLETNRPPYVVKNPKYGFQGGGHVEWEVPWREGTSVRTATRNDLVRMLVPTIAQPDVEVIQGYGFLTNILEDFRFRNESGIGLRFNLTIYVNPRSEESFVVPFHRCRCVLRDRLSKNAFEEFEFTMHPPHVIYPSFMGGVQVDTVTIERTSSEIIAHGPGKCIIVADAFLDTEPQWLQSSNLCLRFILNTIGCELPLEIDVQAVPAEPQNNELKRWSLKSL